MSKVVSFAFHREKRKLQDQWGIGKTLSVLPPIEDRELDLTISRQLWDNGISVDDYISINMSDDDDDEEENEDG